MKSLKDFLTSGIIERFCLGLSSPEENEQLMLACQQSPQLQTALREQQFVLEQYARTFQHQVPQHSRENILNQIKENTKLENTQVSTLDHQINEYIALSSHSKIHDWQQLIQPITPAKGYDNIHLHQLYSTEDKDLFVAWVKHNVPAETHPDIEESFLILEGQCLCRVNGEEYSLKAGDYMLMPTEGYHEIEVTSDIPVKAILSKVKVA